MVPFLAGATLPDITGYVSLLLCAMIPAGARPEWADQLPLFFLPFHSIAGFTLLSWLLALCFQEKARAGVFLNLELGALIHFSMDFFQALHAPSNYLFFPFACSSSWPGWFGSESSLIILPALAVLAAGVFLRSYFKADTPS